MLSPSYTDYCKIEAVEKPRLIVVIDTEEEFDWSQGFSRLNTSVVAMRHIMRVQAIFDRYGITPVYVIDYPVASQKSGYQILQEIHAAGRCVIGAHLHPWVNPPYEEEVTRRNSFPGNLPRWQELEKLKILRDCIEEKFGIPPVVYKAGRYGVGPHTAGVLDDLGFEVDLSVCPCMDYSGEGGPDFTRMSTMPYWFGKNNILELPLTVGFSGLVRRWGRVIHHAASTTVLESLHAVGMLARLGLVNKVWLSPEGYLSSEHIKLVKNLYSDGVRVFSFAFHSPSIDPGHTPYVTSANDLDKFLYRCERFFDYFLGSFGGCPSTPLQLKQELARGSARIPREGT